VLAAMGVALLVASGVASAQATEYEFIHQTVQIDEIISIGDTCNGAESIAISGTVMYVFRALEDANGGLHFLSGHVNYQGVGGTGLVSGDKYRIVLEENVVGNQMLPSDSGSQEVENTATVTYKVISMGPTPNLVGHFTQHFTYDANGEFVSYHETTNEGCRG